MSVLIDSGDLVATCTSADLFPVVDKLPGSRRGESILVKALHHSLACRLEHNSPFLHRDWTAVFRYRRRLIADARLVEIVSHREHDPLAVCGRSQRVPADRGLGRQLAVFLLQEEIEIAP